MPEDSYPDHLTIAQATERLGVSERTLRRTLTLAQFTGKTVAGERQTKKGRRPTALLSPELLTDLASYFEAQGLGDSPADSTAEPQANTGTSTGDSPAASEFLPPNDELYSRIIAEKDARISDLQAALLRERENLEVEREAHRRAETLHLGSMTELQALRERAQELERQNARLIEALPVDASQSASESEDKPPVAPEKHPGFWERLFKKKG